MDEPREIDWSTAVVKDRALTVELTGEPSRRFASHLEEVLRRLDPRRAAAIEATKRRIKVAVVDAESAADLRHLLESAVAQTNADLLSPAPTDDGAPQDDVDTTLTAAFREFAPAEAR